MEIVCVGLSHHTAAVDLRERFAIAEKEIGAASNTLKTAAGVQEAVIISTCNRVELYLAAHEATAALQGATDFLGLRGAGSTDAFFRYATGPSIRHLFRVASGLDSMVLGETEILGQVKKAYAAAAESGATGKHLNKLFQRAFHVAKDVRTNTNITRGSVSVGSAAVDLAEKIFGRLAGCKVMILGAGEMSELTAGALQARGVHTIFVANRSHERAVLLAQKMGGQAIHFDAWQNDFREVDILIGSTAAPHHVLSAPQLAKIMATRPDRPLFCIDLAVPRDIDPAVNALDSVYLYDIDSLQAIADQSIKTRQQELAACEQIVERHVMEFSEWLAGGWAQASIRYSTAVSGGQT